MKIERIDTDEIIGLTCPKTGNRILWEDEDIAAVLPGTIVLAVITSLFPEGCGVERLPLAEAWKLHYENITTRKEMTLDEVVEAFGVHGKAFKVVEGGMACGPLRDVTPTSSFRKTSRTGAFYPLGSTTVPTLKAEE